MKTYLLPFEKFQCHSFQYKRTEALTKAYRGSPTSTVSTSTNFIAIGIKLVLVELLCSKISTSGNWLCSTHQYEFRIVRFFQNPKNRTKRGPPVDKTSHYFLFIKFPTYTGVPAQYDFWDLEKIVLCEIRTSEYYIANSHQYGFY